MQINYVVHTCSEDTVAVEATVNGRPVQATVPGLVVELVSSDGAMGHTLRLLPDDMDATKELFAIGANVIATYTAA